VQWTTFGRYSNKAEGPQIRALLDLNGGSAGELFETDVFVITNKPNGDMLVISIKSTGYNLDISAFFGPM